MIHSFGVNFFLRRKTGRYAYRSMDAVPRIGDKIVFDEVRYTVAIVEWCLDEDASRIPGQARVNIEIEKVKHP